MAKKRTKQLSEEELKICELLKNRNIPIVSLDVKWLRLFPEEEKTREIKELEYELKELLKRQGKVNTELKDIKVVREKLTRSILDTAEDLTIPEAKRLKKQEASQRLIVEAREKQQELEAEQLELPQLIKDANNALIFESVRVCYSRIEKNKNDIDKLAAWIEDTRNKLKERVVIKQDKELKNKEMYAYLHDILGANVMEAFDEEGS